VISVTELAVMWRCAHKIAMIFASNITKFLT
jgi:hypothetical protein